MDAEHVEDGVLGVGVISGLFFGSSVTAAGLDAAALGALADHAGLATVYV